MNIKNITPHSLIFIVITLYSLSMSAQDREVTARVVDAVTNEPLPYATVYAGPGKGTITNADGDFTISVADGELLRFSYVGYETLRVAGSAVHNTVRLKPQSLAIGEVTVLAQEKILIAVDKLLDKEYRKYKNERSTYFYRMNTTYRNELVEAFMEASSAVNLRDLLFLKGRRGQATLYGLDETGLDNMNLHHMLELSPKINDSRFWNVIYTPFFLPDRSGQFGRINYEVLNNHYNMQSEILVDEEGNKTYKITMESKRKNRRILTGTLYIDGKTKHLLRFDGQVENMEFDLIKDFYIHSSPIQLSVMINFKHDKGYTEVASIANTLSDGNITVNSLLYNIDDLDLGLGASTRKEKRANQKTIKSLAKNDNVLATIDDAGFDEMLWSRSNIVQRTAMEVQIAGLEEQMILRDSVRQVDSSMDMLVDHLTRFGKSLPQEKVYLHMDNTNYFIGDTIWFAAYTRQTNDNMPSNVSGVLYVELYNNDGYLVERKQVEMIRGRGYGNFVLDEDNFAGHYELRAYTRWQLNWGLYEHFHSKESEKWFLTKDMMDNYLRDYHKLYSRVFPVYDAPKEEGNYAQKMSMRPMRRVFTHDPDDHDMVLTLYPEGGNLVEGLPCRVAFEAAWDNGQALEGSIGNAKAELRGRGTFEVTPDKDMERDIIFTTKDGKKVKAKLPKPEKKGVALRVTQDNDSVSITVHTTADLASETMGITIMHEGVLEKFEPINGDSHSMAIAISDLTEGVNQATVFDSHGHVWADRLFFVRNDNTGKPNVSISGIKDSYEPYEPVNLSISAPHGKGIMSLAVRDASHTDNTYDNASMLTEMLLSSEIKGFVEDPEWFFEKNDAGHNRALDLLMMTQGWRRFDWREMAVRGAWEMKQVAERTPVIEGQVYNIGEGEYDRDFDMEYQVAQLKTQQLDEDLSINVFNFLKKRPTPDGMETSDEDVNIVDAMGGFSFVDTKTNKETFGINRFEQDFEDINNDSRRKRNKYYPLNHWQGNIDGLMYGYGGSTRNLAEMRYFPGRKNKEFRKKGLKVRAEVATLGSVLKSVLTKNKTAFCEVVSEDGHFKFQLPHVYGDYILFISAADTLKKGYQKTWISLLRGKDQDEGGPWTDFSVRVNWPYPRFVKPYNYYQTHLNYSGDPLLRQSMLDDGSLQLDNVSVWGKHSSLHSVQDSLPALIIDAYDAYNQTLDAGFLNGSQEYIVRNFVGDYGLGRPYATGYGYGIQEAFGYDEGRRAFAGITSDPDEVYRRRNLRSFAPYDMHGRETMSISSMEWSRLHHYERIDKYVLYTDYQPRLSGSERYSGSNLPLTRIATYPYPDDSKRYFYKNRRYKFSGFSYVNTFYNPDYSKRKLSEKPKDYRRTLYWNPFLVLDDNGHADIQFYNNANKHKLSVDAQGTSSDGTMIVGREM